MAEQCLHQSSRISWWIQRRPGGREFADFEYRVLVTCFGVGFSCMKLKMFLNFLTAESEYLGHL